MLSVGQHDKVPMKAYIEDPSEEPSLNASIAKLIINQSPLHAKLAHARLNPHWEPEKPPDRVDFGSIAHAALLEGRNVMAVIEHEDWRTNAAKEQRAQAWANGQHPILRKHVHKVEDMVAAAERCIALSEIGQCIAPLPQPYLGFLFLTSSSCRKPPRPFAGSKKPLVEYASIFFRPYPTLRSCTSGRLPTE